MNPFDLFSPPREFAIYNPSEAPVEFGYDGEQRTIPGRDTVIQPDPRDPLRCHSCIDTDGRLVPGTLVLRDVFSPKGLADGGRTEMWSAAAAIRERLGLNPNTGAGSGSYHEKGISLISTRPSPDEVASVKADANARHEQFLIKWAAHLQEDIATRGQAHKAVGMNYVMTPTQHMELAKAEAILKVAEQKYRDEALKSVGLVPENDSTGELDSFVLAKAQELAAKHKDDEQEKAALARALAADPAFHKMLHKEFWDEKKKRAKGQN